jgi:hypothetical protein
MKSYRAFGLALSLMCLLAAPHTFAGSSDKDKDKDTKKVPAKQSTPPPKTQAGSTTSHPSTTTTAHPATTSQTSAQGSHNPGTTNSQHPGMKQGLSGPSKPIITPPHKGFHAAAPETRAKLEHINAHPSQLDRAHARDLSRAQVARFNGHAAPFQVRGERVRFQLTHMRIVPTTYYYRRTAFYDAYGWQPAVYVYGFAPRYGLWDATFLAFALDHIAEDQYAMMFYNHRNDAEMQQWMQDSDRLAAENDDLRAKVENMKLQMTKLDGQGVAVDPSYVPPDAQDVALSPEVITALTASKD